MQYKLDLDYFYICLVEVVSSPATACVLFTDVSFETFSKNTIIAVWEMDYQ